MATIYINNKPVYDLNELEQLNSEEILSVEQINNPGVKYGSDVRAILKINTQRKQENFAAQVRLQGIKNHRFSNREQLDLSYGTKKIHWYSKLSHNDSRSQVDGFSEYNTWNNTYSLQSYMMDWEQKARYITGSTGLIGYLRPNHETGLSYTYQYSKDIYFGGDTEILKDQAALIDSLLNQSYSNNKYQQQAVNCYYIGTFKNNWKLTFNADYIHRDGDNYGYILENSSSLSKRTVSTVNRSLYNLYAAQFVITHPFNRGTLEFGSDFSHMDHHQNYTNHENYLPEAIFLSNETKLAGFMTWNGNMSPLNYLVGMRYEQFHLSYYENDDLQNGLKNTYHELYPNVSLSLPTPFLNLSLNYSKKTSRPTFYQLRNGIDYTSRFLYSRGNPSLKASQIHDISLDMNYQHLFLSLGYSYTKNRIALSDELWKTDPVTIMITHKNIPKYQGLNAMIRFQHQIGPWNTSWSAAVYKNYFSRDNYAGNPIQLNHPYGYFTAYNTFSCFKKLLLNLDARYITAGNSGEIFMEPLFSLDFGFRNAHHTVCREVRCQPATRRHFCNLYAKKDYLYGTSQLLQMELQRYPTASFKPFIQIQYIQKEIQRKQFG